jgi:hypothetical protein
VPLSLVATAGSCTLANAAEHYIPDAQLLTDFACIHHSSLAEIDKAKSKPTTLLDAYDLYLLTEDYAHGLEPS